MDLPKIGSTQVEKKGVAAVETAVREGLGFIFRLIPDQDFGVDGLIEVVNQETGEVTGKLIGVQIKARRSDSQHKTDDGRVLYIKRSTGNYWRGYSLPVVVALVHTPTGRVFWTVADDENLEETDTQYKLLVPESQPLDSTATEAIRDLATRPSTKLRSELDSITEEISRVTEEELERHRAMWREGNRTVVRQWVDDLASSPALLAALKPSVAANVLRYAAGVTLDDDGDVEEAEALMHRAHKLDPDGDDLRLRAGLRLSRGHPQEAIELLSGSTKPDAKILRAEILREIGDPTKAIEVLDAITPSRDVDLADAWRLRALLALEEGHPGSAEEAIEKAESHSPDGFKVRLARAKLTFYQALLPRAVPASVPPWPQPVSEELVRRNAKARSRLREAAERFGELLELDWTRRERKYLEAWKLAPLCLDPESRREATEFAESVLSRSERQPFVLFWAAVTGLGLKFDAPLERYDAEVDRGADIQEALLVAATLSVLDRHEKLRDWLDGRRSRFAEAGAADEWLLWRARASIGEGELESAQELIEQISDEACARSLNAELLEVESRKREDADEFTAFLERAWEETRDPHWLLEVCQQHARAGDWELVAPHVDFLLDVYPTYPVRRLGIFARYHTGDFAGCEELITQTLEDVRLDTERSELLRMRGESRRRLGDIPGATQDLKSVVAASEPEPATGDLLALVRARHFAGHVHEIASIARRLRSREDLDASACLMLCSILAHDDPDLAREFWHRADDEGIDDEAVTTALALGYSLGLDEHLSELTERMQSLAEAEHPSVRQLSLDELTTWHRDREERQGKVLELYRRGEVATHLVADFLGVPLVRLYHVLPKASEAISKLRHSFPLQLRDGSRGVPDASGEVARPGRLALDLSALLLGQHLGILAELEDAFAPLRIPHQTVIALRKQRDRLRHHQPSRVETSRQLLRAERQGRIHAWQGELPSLSPDEREAAGNWWKWVALLERAHRENAFVLDLPLSGESEHGRPTDVAGSSRLARLVTVSDVCGFLVANGFVDSSELQTEVIGPARTDSLGEGEPKHAEAGVDEDGDRIRRDAVIYMTEGGAEALESSGALTAASDCFRLFVDPSDQDARRAQVDLLSEVKEDVEWLNRLIRRISDGLSDGRYDLLPDRGRFSGPDGPTAGPPAAEEDEEGDGGEQELEKKGTDAADEPDVGVNQHDSEGSDEPRSLSLLCLRDVVSLPSDRVDAVWIADRWSNRHAFAGSTRVTDVLELVSAMEKAEHIAPERRWRIRRQLRAANVRIVPFSPDEIVHYLRQASIEEGTVVETPALRTVRQYAASVVNDADSLRMPSPQDVPAGELGELEVLRSYSVAVREALLEVWAEARDTGDAESLAEAEAKSRWIVRNLYVSTGLLRVRAHAPGVGAEDRVDAIEAASLLAFAVELIDPHGGIEASDTAAASYAEWIYEAVIESRANRDSEFRTVLVDHLRNYLTEWTQGTSEDSNGRVVGLTLAGRVFDALPSDVRDLLSEDAAFMEEIGRRSVSALTIGRWDVDLREFAEAGAEALRREDSGRSSDDPDPAVAVLESEPPATLTMRALGPDVLELVPESEEDVIRLRDKAFGILHPDESRRRDAAEAVRQEADWCVAEWETEVERILALPDPQSRFEALVTRRSRSVPRHYSELAERWEATGRISQKDLGPFPVRELVRHLRLNTAGVVHGKHSSSETSGSSQSRVDRAARILVAEEGLETAFARIAGLPVPLPTVLFEAVADLSPGAREEFVRHLLQRPTSPVGVVQALRLVAWLGQTEARYRRLARFWIVRLLRWDVEDEIELLVLLVRKSFRAMRRGSTLTEDSSTTPQVSESGIEYLDAVIAAWTHGHRFVTALRSLGGDPTGLVAWVKNQVELDTEHLFSEERESQRICSDPTVVRPSSFIVGALQYVAKDGELWGDRGIPSKLESHLTKREGETVLPHPDLLRDLENTSDRLRSWVQPERQPDGSMMVDSAEVVPSRYAPESLLDDALQGLHTDAGDPGPWLTLEVVLGGRRMTGQEAERFEDALAGCELSTIASELGEVASLAIIRLARQAGGSDDTASIKGMRESLLTLGKERSPQSTTPSTEVHGVQEEARTGSSGLPGAVLQGLYLLAQAESSPSRAMSVFGDDLQELGRSEPAYLRQIRDVLENLVLSRPVDEAAELLGVLLEARGADPPQVIFSPQI